MEITIKENLKLAIYGFSGVADDGDYTDKAFKLTSYIWSAVKLHGLKTKGQNIWVYESGNLIFAGVELERTSPTGSRLEVKQIKLPKYAYYKHIGPYSLIKQTGQIMRAELKRKGLKITLPYIEIYGHWTDDEHKLETELLMTLL